MRNLLIIFAFILGGTFVYAQDSDMTLDSNNSIYEKKKKNKDKKDLSAFELEIGSGSLLLPSINANFYLKEHMILKVSSPNLSLGSVRRVLSGSQYGFRTFLEFRKYFNEKYYLSHGPEIAYYNTRQTEEDGSTFRTNEGRFGYNLGAGFRYKERITAGSYINPSLGIGENGISYNQGRLFAGTLANVYVAYRF